MSHGLREHLFISFKTAWISIAQSIALLVFRLISMADTLPF